MWLCWRSAALLALALRYTRFGRHVFAVGSNELTARLCGVPVPRVKLGVYVLGGAFAGVGAVLQFAYLTGGDPTTARRPGAEHHRRGRDRRRQPGGRPGHGRGHAGRRAHHERACAKGCTKLGLSNWVQEIVTGGIIIAAVILEQVSAAALALPAVEPTEIAQAAVLPRRPRPIVRIGAGSIVRDAHCPRTGGGVQVAGLSTWTRARLRARARFGIARVASRPRGGARDARGAVFDVALRAGELSTAGRRLPEGSAALIQKPMGVELAEARASSRLRRRKIVTPRSTSSCASRPAVALRAIVELRRHRRLTS